MISGYSGLTVDNNREFTVYHPVPPYRMGFGRIAGPPVIPGTRGFARYVPTLGKWLIESLETGIVWGKVQSGHANFAGGNPPLPVKKCSVKRVPARRPKAATTARPTTSWPTSNGWSSIVFPSATVLPPPG